MFRTAVRNVLAHKARLLMTVLAVMLGVAFVSGTLVYTSTLSAAYRKVGNRGLDSVDVAVRPGGPAPDARPGEEPRPNRELLHRMAKLPETQSVTGVVSGFTAVADEHGRPMGQGWSTKGANYSTDSGPRDARYPLKEGRPPKGPDEVALDAGTARRADYRIGDIVRLSVDGPVRLPRLSGIFTTDDGDVTAGGSLALFDTPTAQHLFGAPGEFGEIDVKAVPGTSQTELKAVIDKVLPRGLGTETGQSLADEQALSDEESMVSLRATLLTFAGIALFVAVFLITNTFTMLVARRTRELALLRAVGATRRQVTHSVLTEAFLVGLVASAAGLAAGIGIAAALRPLLGSFGNGAQTLPDGPLTITPTTVIASLAIGVGITMPAAWLPGRRAAKIPPVEAMGSVHAPATTRSLVLRNTVGALLAAAGLAVVLAGSTMARVEDGQLVMALGSAVLMTGVIVLTPLLSRPFIAAATPVLRAFGICGKLARENAVRNPRRTATTASALITALTVLAVSGQRQLEQETTSALSADYTVRMADFSPLSKEVENKLRHVDGVTAVSPMREAFTRVAGHDTLVRATDATTVRQLLRPEFTDGSFTGFGGPNVVVSADTAKERGWHTGTTVPVTYPDGAQGQLTVSGIYRGNKLLSGIITDTRTLDPHLPAIDSQTVLVRTDGGPGTTARRAIAKALGDSPAVLVESKQDVSDSIAHGITTMLTMLYGLLAMAVAVAVLGLVNTLAMSIAERTSEIGMLRALGLDRQGIRRMVRLESLAVSLFGGVLGISLGIFFGWAGVRLLAVDEPTAELVLPWGRLALFLGLTAAVGLLAALGPAHRAAQLDVLTAIKAE